MVEESSCRKIVDTCFDTYGLTLSCSVFNLENRIKLFWDQNLAAQLLQEYGTTLFGTNSFEF